MLKKWQALANSKLDSSDKLSGGLLQHAQLARAGAACLFSARKKIKFSPVSQASRWWRMKNLSLLGFLHDIMVVSGTLSCIHCHGAMQSHQPLSHQYRKQSTDNTFPLMWQAQEQACQVVGPTSAARHASTATHGARLWPA